MIESSYTKKLHLPEKPWIQRSVNLANGHWLSEAMPQSWTTRGESGWPGGAWGRVELRMSADTKNPTTK